MTKLAPHEAQVARNQAAVATFDRWLAEAEAELATMTPAQQEEATEQLNTFLQRITGARETELAPFPAPTTLRGQYIAAALAQAVYKTYSDGTILGEIPVAPGVLVNEPTHDGCATELGYALDSWITVGLRHGDPLPVVGGIDLNPRRVT